MNGRPFLTHGAGYLLNDNRAAGEGKEESDIGLCPHCQKVIKLQEWRASFPGNPMCMKCMAPQCLACAKRYPTEGCLPFVQKIEKLMSEEHAKAQFRKVAGLEPERPMFTYPGRT